MNKGVKRYVRPPPGTRCPPGYVWQMLRFLYGYNDAPLEWYKTYAKAMLDAGYKRCTDEPCLFYKIQHGIYSISTVVVDDGLIASNNPQLNKDLVVHLRKYFEVKDLGRPKFVIGMHIQRVARHHIRISQSLYIRKLAEKFGQLNCKAVHTPAIKDNPLTRAMGAESKEKFNKPYRSLVGGLLWITLTRPDISVAVGELAKISEPRTPHWNAAIRVLRYLVTTIDLALDYNPRANPAGVKQGAELGAGGDASFDSDPETSKSRTGLYALFAYCAIVWAAVFQPVVALSVAEAEYIASNRCAKEVVWLRRILKDIGFPQKGPTPIMCDNNAAIILSENPIATRPRTKHIRRRFHYVREQVRAGEVELKKISGTDHDADFFTKILGKRLFLKYRKNFLK